MVAPVTEQTTQVADNANAHSRWRTYAFWVLTIALLASVALAGLDKAIAGFLVAIVVRGIYTWIERLRRRRVRFWSPVLFLLASLFGMLSIVGSGAGAASD